MAATSAAAARAKSFFGVVTALPKFGVGTRLARRLWLRYPDTYVTVERVKPGKSLQGGKAWGVMTFKGTAVARATEIRGLRKTDWVLYDQSKTLAPAPAPTPPLPPPAVAAVPPSAV